MTSGDLVATPDSPTRESDPPSSRENDRSSQESLASRLLRLEGDPAFQELKKKLSQTNFFRILGAADTERIHSSFWAWVFDPDGSHGLEDFAARRLVTLATDDTGNIVGERLGKERGTTNENINWDSSRGTAGGRTTLDLADLIAFQPHTAAAAPSSVTNYSEISVDLSDYSSVEGQRGAMDILVLLQGEEPDPSASNEYLTLLVGIECKIGAQYDPEQLEKYSAWLHKNPRTSALKDDEFRERAESIMSHVEKNPGPLFSIGFFLSTEKRKLPEELQSPWNAITYSKLIEFVLEPMLTHPRLDAVAESLIEQYIDLTGSPDNEIFTGTTQMDKKLVKQLLERHENTFQIIAAVLREEGMEAGEVMEEELTSSADSRKKGSWSPEDLFDVGAASRGDRVVHEPKNKAPFDNEIVAELYGNRGNALKLIDAGDIQIDEPLASTTLLKRIYKEYGGVYQGSGNRDWTFKTGAFEGLSLREVYDKFEETDKSE